MLESCCRRTTIGPKLSGEGTINLGEAAHIKAASPGGKRYDPNMTPEERASYENGIWMCRTHAALIDRDENILLWNYYINGNKRQKKVLVKN